MINFHFHIERWRYNKKFNLYVSTDGRIKDKKKKLITPLLGTEVGGGAYFVLPEQYHIEGETRTVHRLVAQTWLKNWDRNLTVDHINMNKRDNRLCNLEMVTQEENIRRALENTDSHSLAEEKLHAPIIKITNMALPNQLLSKEEIKNAIARWQSNPNKYAKQKDKKVIIRSNATSWIEAFENVTKQSTQLTSNDLAKYIVPNTSYVSCGDYALFRANKLWIAVDYKSFI